MTQPLRYGPAPTPAAGAQKSPDAFRTISEVADELDVPPHVLRFWETRFTQIKPLKRGGGRRYYRPGDVALLRGIRRLLYDDGMTIKGAQKIIRQRGARFVAQLGSGRDQLDDALPPRSVATQPETADPGSARERFLAPPDASAVKPLLTPERRADLEAALALLSDLRAELEQITRAEHEREVAGDEPSGRLP